MRSWSPLLGTAVLATGLSVSGARADGASGPGPVPVREGFSTLEVGLLLSATAGGAFLLAAGPSILPAPSPALGPAAPDSLDARLSRSFYRPGRGRFLAGAPDLFGAYFFPVLPVLAYGLPVFWAGSRGWNPNHRLLAYTEAVGVTYLVTGLVKYAVGRPRPYTEAGSNHPELRKRSGEDNLSFFSGHASSDFAAGAFVAEDVSRYLRRNTLADADRPTRLVLGWLLPYTVGYGVPAAVGLSRIIDQQHWPSDVLVGALVGTLIAQVAYRTHFDSDGHPRRRHPTKGLRPLPLVALDRQGSATVTLAVQAQF
jgi:membrane-associated phospholipid phosphatase